MAHEKHPDNKMLGHRKVVDGKDDQEGVRTLDDDNFIDDAGVDPTDQFGSDNEGSAGNAPQAEEGEEGEEIKSRYDSKKCSFAPDQEILGTLKESSVGQADDLKQIQKQCMPFLKFKKDEALSVGPHALDLRLPFGEMEVLKENSELIKRQLGLEHVEVLSALDDADRGRAGSKISLLTQNPPSPGSPSCVFLSM